MNWKGLSVLVAALVLAVAARTADAKPKKAPPPPLPSTTEGLLAHFEKSGLEIGLVVLNPENDAVLLAHRAHDLFIPASNVKLVSSAAALDRLGPHYKYHTRFLGDSEIKGGQVLGNLYLVASGDPYVVEERMALWVQGLSDRGLTHVRGDLVLDLSLFDGEKEVAAWTLGGADRSDQAPLGALAFNFSSFNILVEPASGIIHPTVRLRPDTQYFRIENNARLSRKKNSLNIKLETAPDGREMIHLFGEMPSKSKGVTVRRHVRQPEMYAAAILVERMHEVNGFTLGGAVRTGKAPAKAKPIASFESLPLHELVSYSNKYSNNFMSEMIVKTMGTVVPGQPGGTEPGLAQVRGYLRELGIPEAEFQLLDGSGLSRGNRLSPSALARVLTSVSRHFPYAPEFMASLAVWGADGTLKKAPDGLAYRVRGKTGYLNGVKTQSGFFDAPHANGKPLAFSILINDPKRRYHTMTQAMESLVAALLNRDWTAALAVPAPPPGPNPLKTKPPAASPEKP